MALLRRPWVVVSELLLFGLGAGLATTLPQQPDAEEVEAFGRAWPVLGRVTAAAGLHELVTSPGFLAVVLLCLLSLLSLQAQQWPRLLRTCSAPLQPAHFANAPFRLGRPLAGAPRIPETAVYSTVGRVGLLGSPLFHLGLVILTLAGLVRMLTYRDAVGRAFEGEALGPDAFEAERGGWLSRPIQLPAGLRMMELTEERYASGALRQVSVSLGVGGAPGGGPGTSHAASINTPLDLGGVRLYVTSAHGLAAVLELAGEEAPQPLVALLDERSGEWRGGLRPEGGLELRFRANVLPRPRSLEVRALRDGVLLGIAELAPGTEIGVGGGQVLRLAGLPYWVKLHAGRDPSRSVFQVGLVVALLGMLLMFGFTRVDTAVFVEGDRLVVALRAQRFAPLYAERFERLCKEWLG